MKLTDLLFELLHSRPRLSGVILAGFAYFDAMSARWLLGCASLRLDLCERSTHDSSSPAVETRVASGFVSRFDKATMAYDTF